MQKYTIRVIRTLRYVTTSLPEVSSLFLSYSPPCLWWCRNDAASWLIRQEMGLNFVKLDFWEAWRKHCFCFFPNFAILFESDNLVDMKTKGRH